MSSSYGGNTNAPYGDYADPDEWGSGGGIQSGGGLVRITAGELLLDGSLLADGQGGDGSGSGGGIYVATGTLRGSGLIRAAGGNAGHGAGGGGRIAVYAQDYSAFNLDAITAPGGTGNGPGGVGTAHIIEGRAPTRVKSFRPTGRHAGFVSGLDELAVTFSRSIDLGRIDGVIVHGQMGRMQASGITAVDERKYRIEFPRRLSEDGFYHFTIPPTLRDVEGFALDQNANGIPGEPDDGYSFTLILDTVPPRITRHTPAGDVAGTVSSIDVWFSERIDKATFTTADVAITRPDGSSLAASSVQEVGFNRFRVGFAPQTATGVYSIQVGPNITDLAGNLMDQDGDGVFGEPDEDVYIATVNLVPVDLGLNNLVVHADTLWAGEPVTVSWSGFNRSGAPLLGNWTDGVYLSSDDQWDIRDVLLTTVPHTGGLAENETYSQSVEVVIPGKLPDNYHILVRADVEFQQQELDKTDNLITSDPIPLDVRPLTPDGTPVQGTLTRTDRADYYVVQVAPGDSLRLTLEGHAPTGSNELYVAYEAIPTRQQFDHRANLVGQDQQIVLTGEPTGGTYYVMVYGSEIDTETEYDLLAEAAPVLVTGISPHRHGNAEPAMVTLSGAGFDASTIVEFLAADAVVYSPELTERLSSSILRVTLDLPAWPADLYDVRVVKLTNDGSPVSYNLESAFQVTQGGTARLETNLIVPNAVGFAIPIRQTIWVEYKNTGDVAMPVPLLTVTGSHTARLTLDPTIRPQGGFGQIPGTSDSVQFLGLGNSDTPWLLRPGDTGRVPVYYLGFSQWARYPQVTFTLGAVTADDGRLINWETQEDNLRRLDLTDAMWAEELQRLQRWFGLTWGEYVRRLAEAAEFSHVTSDSPITSVHDLYWLSRMLMTVDENSQQFLPGDNAGEGTGSALSSSAGTNITSPLENLIGMMSSPYGWREFNERKHFGIDLKHGKGTHLAAMWSGQATYVPYSGTGSQGNRVELTRSDNGQTWRYLHLDESTRSNYFPEGNSRSVSQGDGIAVSGDSGNVDPHLHLDLGQ